MTKDSIICWNCKKMTMEPAPDIGHGWYKCSNCGATHHPHPTRPGQSPIVVEKIDNHHRETKYRHRKARKPKTPAK